MIVVEKFPAEFKIKFSAELRNALADTLRLYLHILVVIKACSHTDVSFQHCVNNLL